MTLHKFIVFIVHARSALLIAGVLGLCGCATIGPQSITAGRGAYTEVINTTEDEQIMNVLVRQRYDETFGMISVASITANLQFSAKSGANFGIGNSDYYSGNLVPLAVGVGYEENPTISYTPLSGEDFMRRMLSPVLLNEWVMLGNNSKHPGMVLALAARRINGLRNPLFDEVPHSPAFVRFVELFDLLRRAGVLDTVQISGTANEGNDNAFLDIHDYQDGHGDSVRELLDLIGIEVKVDGSVILLPIRMALGRSSSAIHLQTRSAYDVMRTFGTGIEIPLAHLEAGIVEPRIQASSKKSQLITIRSSEKRPDNATVQIRFRNWWFYIDATDTQSKRAFMLLRTFIGMRLADPGAAQNAPVITVPVN